MTKEIYSIGMYWIAANLGDNEYSRFNDLHYLVNNNIVKKQSIEQFKLNLKRFLEYDLIKSDVNNRPLESRNFKLTNKGSDYLDKISYNMYHNTAEKYVLEDGEQDISQESMMNDLYGQS